MANLSEANGTIIFSEELTKNYPELCLSFLDIFADYAGQWDYCTYISNKELAKAKKNIIKDGCLKVKFEGVGKNDMCTNIVNMYRWLLLDDISAYEETVIRNMMALEANFSKYNIKWNFTDDESGNMMLYQGCFECKISFSTEDEPMYSLDVNNCDNYDYTFENKEKLGVLNDATFKVTDEKGLNKLYEEVSEYYTELSKDKLKSFVQEEYDGWIDLIVHDPEEVAMELKQEK